MFEGRPQSHSLLYWFVSVGLNPMLCYDIYIHIWIVDISYDYIIFAFEAICIDKNRLEKLRLNCEKQWENHWQCLDKSNHMLEKCRPAEREFNDCVYKKLVFIWYTYDCLTPRTFKKSILIIARVLYLFISSKTLHINKDSVKLFLAKS